MTQRRVEMMLLEPVDDYSRRIDHRAYEQASHRNGWGRATARRHDR